MTSSRRWVRALCAWAFGGCFLMAGCMAAAPELEQEADNDAAESEHIGESQQAITCGHPEGFCLGRCCNRDEWENFGKPKYGECGSLVDTICSTKGGNCGNCWGWISK